MSRCDEKKNPSLIAKQEFPGWILINHLLIIVMDLYFFSIFSSLSSKGTNLVERHSIPGFDRKFHLPFVSKIKCYIYCLLLVSGIL